MISYDAAMPLAALSMRWIIFYLPLVVAAAIVLLCLVLYGGRDLIRLSPLRVRAVASVCFHESIRRRVLWLTPLAILGVVLVSQFQRPLDEQDAMRQATRFCVFASGLLVVIATLILACTNLPREIENRVVYTIVTKPISRLEILIGKIVGFSTVAAVILLIMGVFSWGYLRVQEWRLVQDIKRQLAAGGLDRATEQALKYYRDHGLLSARDYRGTLDVQALSAYPASEDKVRWFNGGNEQEVLVPFRIDPASVRVGQGENGMLVKLSLPWEQQRPMTPDEVQRVAQMADGARAQGLLPPLSIMGAAGQPEQYPAFVQVEFRGPDASPIRGLGRADVRKLLPIVDATGQVAAILPISASYAQEVLSTGLFYVSIQGLSPGVRYAVGSNAPVSLLLPSDDPQTPQVVLSRSFDPNYSTACPILGRTAPNGQQLRGDDAAAAPVGVYAFRNRQLEVTGAMTVEIRTVVDQQGADNRDTFSPGASGPTIVELSVVNRQTGKMSAWVPVPVESRRTAYAEFPAEWLAGGDFDVLIRCLTPGDWLGLTPATMRISAGDGGFALNLFKSYLVLWMLSVMVIVAAIFCSTFLSWPIALVLTVVILLGNWGVTQLGDIATPGVGRQVVNDLFAGAAPAVTETLTRSMESLTAMARTLAAFLPNVSRFSAMEDISQGSQMPAIRLIWPVQILIVYGLEILALSYVFFRNKEVAP